MQGSIYPHCSCRDPQTRKPYRRGKRDGRDWSECPRWNERNHKQWGFVVNTRKLGPGRWEQRRKQGFPTRQAAQKALIGVIGDVQAGTALTNAQRQVTVGEFASAWLAGRVNLAAATRRGYRLTIDHYIAPINGLGRVLLCELTTAHIRSWLARIRDGSLRPERRPEGMRITAATVNQIYTVLRIIVTAAAEEQLLARNPCTRRVELEAAEHHQEPVWSPAEVASFLGYLDGMEPPWALIAYRLALRFGLRRGEIAALRWSDITETTICLRRNAVAVGADVVEGPLKSRRGEDSRTLPLALDPAMPAVLQAVRRRQLADRLASGQDWQGGDNWREGGYVVADQLGAAVPPWRLTDTFRGLCRAAGLRVIKLHTCRKTCGTALYEATRDVKFVQRILGHSTAAITSELYILDRPERDADSAAAVARYLAK